jgi:hypothetical protein
MLPHTQHKQARQQPHPDPPSAAVAPRSSSSPQPAPTSPMSNSSMAAAAAAAAAPGAPLARSESAAQAGGSSRSTNDTRCGCTAKSLPLGAGCIAFGARVRLQEHMLENGQAAGSEAHPPLVASCSKKPLLTVSRGQLSSRMIGVGGVSRRAAGEAGQGRGGGMAGEG